MASTARHAHSDFNLIAAFVILPFKEFVLIGEVIFVSSTLLFPALCSRVSALSCTSTLAVKEPFIGSE
jgi:hypothetical protein